MVSQLKKNLNRRNKCQCLLLSRFCGLSEWIVIGIGMKSNKEHSKLWITQSLNDSTAFSEPNKCLFSSKSAVKWSGTEGAI